MEGAVNYHEISERIATAGSVSEDRLRRLRADGFDAVVNLLPDSSEVAVPNECEIIEAQGLEYHYIPVDFGNPAEADFRLFRRVMENAGDKKILIHCAANYRVSAFYALHAMQDLDWSWEDARAHIASIWNPADYPVWKQFIDRVNSPWQKSSRHSTGPASRRTALRLGHILPVCSLIAPCPAGAGPVSVLAGLSPRTVKSRSIRNLRRGG